MTEDEELIFDDLISASVVHVEGSDEVTIPRRMGLPRHDQMQGTPRERLCELSGRVCYDSLGKGRATNEYHAHLLDTGHHSVYEHAWFTIHLPTVRSHPFLSEQAMYAFARLRGADLEWDDNGLRLYFNLRHVIDLNREKYHYRFGTSLWAYEELCAAMKDEVSMTMPIVAALAFPGHLAPKGTEPSVRDRIDETTHISMYLSGSRGFSHEQVRHRFNMSQRSTRYVDESTSPYVTHPMITKYLDSREVISDEHQTYDVAVKVIEGALIRDGVNKTHARKQARGAARSFLRTSLFTEMIFTASIADWRGMIQARATDAADAEIRVLYNRVLNALMGHSGEVAEFFEDLVKYQRPAVDGIGFVVG